MADWIGGTFYERELVASGHDDAQVARLVELQACANRLPPHLQRLYRLHFVDGMSMRAISALVGIPTKSVWQQVGELRRRLASCLAYKQTPLL
jgi:DNA-directed RNA polymerase specialized sigma24 family protein